MKISSAKTEVLHLSRIPDQCVLQVNGAIPKEVEKFKYLGGVSLTLDERQDKELATQIGMTNAVMRALHYSIVIKQVLSKNAKFLIFEAILVPFLTCGHESWVITERVR